MNTVAERHLDLALVQTAWQGLNKLVPLGQITSEKDYKRRVRVMDELLDRIGANESHRLMPLLDLVTKEVESYENKNHTLPDATPAAVLAYLMEEHIGNGNYQHSDTLPNALAQTSLGAAYYNGTGVEQDKAEAFKWFHKAAAQGNATAINNLKLKKD